MVNSEWQRLRLDEVCERITDGAHFSPKEDPNGLPMASVKDLTRFGVQIENCKRISKSDFDSLIKQGCSPQKGDVLIAKDGNSALDTVCVYNQDDEIVLLSSVAILRPSSRVTSDFLNYFLDSPITRQNLKDNFRSGSAIPRVVLKDFRRYHISIPSIETQEKIGRYLRALDDKIELNRQINATLEQLARALFKSWFVDFDPVRAKSSGEPEESICRRLGLTPELLALFPTALEDSEMGEIPAGWEVKPLDTVATFLNGIAAQKYPSQGKDDLPVIKIAQLRKGNTEGADVANASTLPLAYIVEDGDVLFSWSGSLEVEIWGGGLGILNQHLFKVGSKQFPKWFYFSWTRHHLPGFRIIASSKATTMGHIQRKHLTRANVLIPPTTLLNKMGEYFAPLLLQTEQLSAESCNLAAMRDELLPQLLSGILSITHSNDEAATGGI